MRVKRPVRGDLALEPELVGIGRKQQLDRGGVEADAMVQPLDPVFRVDALDGQHSSQDLRFRDAGRIASEQRLDVERLRRLDHVIDAVARNIHPRQLVHHLIDLGDDDALLEGGRFDDDRRVLRVRTHVKVAVAVGAAGHGQRDVRRKVDEVPAEQFDVGVDCAELDLSRTSIRAPSSSLWGPEKEKSSFLAIPFSNRSMMLGQHDAGLHNVKIVQHLGIGFGQAGRQEVRLLLIVAFEADTIPGPDYRFEQCGRIVGCNDLTLGEFAARLETIVADSPLALPIDHIVQLPLVGDRRDGNGRSWTVV